jgi:hypothetical protein
VAHDAHARVRREHPLELARRQLGAVGEAQHVGVLAVPDAHAAAGWIETYAAPAAVLTRALSSGQSATASSRRPSPRSRGWARRLSRRRVIAPDDDRRLELARATTVELEAGFARSP